LESIRTNSIPSGGQLSLAATGPQDKELPAMSRSIRLSAASWTTVVVSAAALLCIASIAQARPSTPPSLYGPAAPVSSALVNAGSLADTGASDVANLGSAGWAVQSSTIATQTGAQISTPGSTPVPGFR
jgi:hypothetical protein